MITRARLLCSSILWIAAMSVSLAGCSTSQPPISASNALPQTSSTAQHAARGKSWMLPDATASDLIYVTGGCDGTCVLSYPGGEMVGSLNVGFGLNSGVCSDSHGNVYIADNNDSPNSAVVEYAHGGTTPIARFNLPGRSAGACSVDPTSGNLAVMFIGSNDDVAIFTNASQEPQLYAALDGFSCAYDPVGNLFVGGLSGQSAGLAELPKGSSHFGMLTIKSDRPIWGAGQVQWYGNTLSYSSGFINAALIYRLKIYGTNAEVVKTTRLDHTRYMWYPWIYQGKIIVAWVKHGVSSNELGIWDYPKGGKVIQKITGFDIDGLGLESVTVSVAPH